MVDVMVDFLRPERVVVRTKVLDETNLHRGALLQLQLREATAHDDAGRMTVSLLGRACELRGFVRELVSRLEGTDVLPDHLIAWIRGAIDGVDLDEGVATAAEIEQRNTVYAYSAPAGGA